MTTTSEVASRAAFDAARHRADFPILARRIRGRPLVYLDNAATSQKPRAVIDTLTRYYEEHNANIHRGVYQLSAEATAAYEDARGKAQRLLHAGDASEVVFVRGTTEAVNLVAQSFVRPRVKQGDEILITHMEHHSNIVPWQLLRDQTGIVLKVAPITDEGALDLGAFERLLTPRTRFVSVVHVSNSLGTVNPIGEIVALAHERGVPVMVDGAQAAPHLRVDVRALDCDFYAVSGHKMFGPTGIGLLYGKAALLDEMPPYHGGGEMIRSVTFAKTTFAPTPAKFEAGTPHIAGAIGLGAAIDYLGALDWDGLHAHESDLLAYATERLTAVPGLRIIGTAPDKACVVSFVLAGAHAHDVGTILDETGIAVRTGHHCTQPVMDRFGVPATVRASFALYNTRADVDALVNGLGRVNEVFG